MFADAASLRRVEHETARILAEMERPVEVYAAVLDAIGRSLGWELGAVWEVGLNDNRLRCVRTWHAGAGAPEFQQLSQRQARGARPNRQHVVEIPQHRPGAGVAPAGRVHREIAEAVLGRPGQDGQQETASSRRPVHVEPMRERRGGAVTQDRPQLPVE